MLALHELQRRFAAAVVDGDGEPVAQAVIDDAPGAVARLGIYANHFRVTLIDALAAAFPVVRQLVGPPFFQAAARQYVRQTPPASPRLFEYGAGFPQFLERLPEARPLAYLADVARLEWAINEAWHAPDAPAFCENAMGPLSAGVLSALRVHLHPSCRLIASPFPVDRIWSVHQGDCSDPDVVDLGAGGTRLLVHRQEDDVGWVKLSPADFAFLDELITGTSLEGALVTARTADSAFAPTALLAALIEGGLVSSISAVS